MAELLRQFFQLAFLMRRPQDVDAGETTLQVGVGLALITYVGALASIDGVGPAVLRAVFDVGLTGAALYVALRLTGRENRFVQAFGGYSGAVAVVNAFAIPVYLSAGPASSQPGLAEFVLLVWNLSLLGHVIRHTFETRLPIGILIAFVYVIVLTSLLNTVLPLPAAGA